MAVTKDVVVRDDTGRFQPGQSGNPLGRPRKADIVELKHSMEIALREHVKPEDLRKILKTIVLKAQAGDVKAAKLILEFFISKARDTEDAPDAAKQYVFQIENATFGAVQNGPRDIEVQVIPPKSEES
jgi:hypothetical protein